MRLLQIEWQLAPYTLWLIGEGKPNRLSRWRPWARFVSVAYVCPRTFIEIAPRLQGGCILIDVQQGHRLYARLRALGVRIPTIVLVDPDEIQVAVSVMKQGAFDVFERPADERALRFAMDRALRDTGPKDSMPENLEAMGRVGS